MNADTQDIITSHQRTSEQWSDRKSVTDGPMT
jgi:hypothetical protein